MAAILEHKRHHGAASVYRIRARRTAAAALMPAGELEPWRAAEQALAALAGHAVICQTEGATQSESA